MKAAPSLTAVTSAAVGAVAVAASVYSAPQIAWVGSLVAPAWGWAVWLLPLTVDLFTALASVLIVLRHDHEPTRRVGWLALVAAALFSGFGNMLHALTFAQPLWPDARGWIVALLAAAWPTFVVVTGPHLAVLALRSDPRPATMPPAADGASDHPTEAAGAVPAAHSDLLPGPEPEPEQRVTAPAQVPGTATVPSRAVERLYRFHGATDGRALGLVRAEPDPDPADPVHDPVADPVPAPPDGDDVRSRLIAAYLALAAEGKVDRITGEPSGAAMVERAGCGSKVTANRLKRDEDLAAVHAASVRAREAAAQ
jgi:hypothetical protein